MNCPNCQTVNPDHARFCLNCGQRLVVADRESQGELLASSPQFNLNRYLPQELVSKLEAARSRHALVGERRVITMLFCDVKGSTTAAEQVDPELWTDIMNGAFEHMIRPIYKYEGTVPRLMGDAILAFFGAPITHEDDPQRAVLAGLEIQAGVKLYTERIRREHGLEFGLRVGINTGLVVVGEIGSDLRMEYTAIGDAINLAARMEQTAAVGTVQISEDTGKLIAPFFELEALGAIEVKGKSAPVQTYRVLRAKAVPGRLRGLEGLSSPLVGRDSQLALLAERMSQLAESKGSFVAVIGEAGLGKSTLIMELQKSQSGSNNSWLKGDALSYTRSISYFPWRQIIRRSVDAHDGDSPADVRHRLRYVCDCCTLPGGDIPFLEAMLAVESDESLKVVAGYQGEALVQRMVDATRGYLCGLATEGPLVIILDDIHWADEASMNLLSSLADLTETQPILFICLSRPEKTAPGWRKLEKIGQTIPGKYSSISLEPLGLDQTDALLTNLLGVNNLPQAVRDLITEKADGNPFFIEELIRSLIETKQIVRENGHWKAVGERTNIALPNTLRGVLSARIDRLPEATRHVLQTASVIGRTFDLPVLKVLTEMDSQLASHIEDLQEAGLIIQARNEYAFRHVLIQEAAYDSILLKNRIDIHRQIGNALEETYAGRIEEFTALIAHHFYASKDPRSLKYDLLAGEEAARLFANTEASTHFSRALEVAVRDQADGSQIRKIHDQLGHVLELSGKFDLALNSYDEMQEFFHAAGDRSAEMAALMAKAKIHSIFSKKHDPARSEQLLVQALQISRELGDREVQTQLNWNLMLNYLFSRRFDKSLQHGELALTLARELGNREQLAFVLNDLCRLYGNLGNVEQAYAVVAEARALWRDLDNPTMLADGLGAEAHVAFTAGDFERSLKCSTQALEMSEKVENLWGQAYNRMLISLVYLEQGRVGQALKLSEEGIVLGERAGLLASSIAQRSDLAFAFGTYGAVDKGMELIELALKEAESKQPEWKDLPLAIKARLYLLRGDTRSGLEIAGNRRFAPISIPIVHHVVVIEMANVELSLAQGNFNEALASIDILLDEVAPLTRVDIPEIMHRKADALVGLHKLDEAYHILTEACSRAEEIGSRHNLWSILTSLGEVSRILGNEEQAKTCRRKAREIVEGIADDLTGIGIRDLFLGKPDVRLLVEEN